MINEVIKCEVWYILYQTNVFFVFLECLLLAQVKVNIFMQKGYLFVSI